MRLCAIGTVVGAGILLSGCVTGKDGTYPGASGERIAHSEEMQTIDPSWQRVRITGFHRLSRLDNIVYFAPDGRLRAEYKGSRKGTVGTWQIEGDQICTKVPVRARECWPYRQLQPGETVKMKSSLGLQVAATMVAP